MWKDKVKDFTLSLVGGLWVTLAPIHSILGVVLSLVLLDLFAGIYRSLVVDKQPFEWKRVSESFIKTIPYMFVVLAGFGADHLIGMEGLWVTRAFALMVSTKEIKSLGKNTGFDLDAVLQGRPKPKE